MDKKNQYERLSLEKVVKINDGFISGDDPITLEKMENVTVPEIINHNSYGVDTMVKPIAILSTQAYAGNDDAVGKYYKQLGVLISGYNLSIFDQYTEYYVNRYISQVLQNIQADIKKVLNENGIPCYNIDLYNAFKNFHSKAHEIFIDYICVYRLNTIEGMAAAYVKDLNFKNRECLAQTGMDIIREIFAPYLNAIVQITVFELYNTVMKYIYNNLLYETTVEDEAPTNLAKMNTIEQQLTPVFNATMRFLFYNYSNMILNCFFSRTHQDHDEDDDF